MDGNYGYSVLKGNIDALRDGWEIYRKWVCEVEMSITKWGILRKMETELYFCLWFFISVFFFSEGWKPTWMEDEKHVCVFKFKLTGGWKKKQYYFFHLNLLKNENKIK